MNEALVTRSLRTRDPSLAGTATVTLHLVLEENKVAFDAGLVLAGSGRTSQRLNPMPKRNS